MDGSGWQRRPVARALATAAAVVAPLLVVAAAFVLIGLGRDDRPAPLTLAVIEEDASDRGAPVAIPPATEPVSEVRSSQEPPQREPEPDVRAPVVQLRDGGRVEVRAKPGGERVGTLREETEFGSPTVLSVRRERPGWIGVSTHLVPNDEVGWIRAEPDLVLGDYVEHRITVDLSERRARLFRAGELTRSWPVTIGAPGTETPTGRFAITDSFEGGLHPAYGCCALALTATQPNLPDGWVGGDRIAFHGTDAALGEAASTGCLRSADGVLRDLIGEVPLGTPVVIGE